MNAELDALLCLIDGKITAFRMMNKASNKVNNRLIAIQKEVQDTYDMNKEGYYDRHKEG